MRLDPDANPEADPDAALRAAIAEASAASPLATAADAVSLEWARSALEAHYGLTGGLTLRAGGRNTRFRLELADGTARDFQVSPPGTDVQTIDFQSQALLHIARVDPGLRVQRLLASQDGAPWLQLADDLGRPRSVRLLSLLDGSPMAEAPHSPGDAVARTLARLDRALARFWHIAGEKELPGDLQRADRIRPLLDLVPEANHRALAHQALDGFVQRAKPVLPALRRQPIHNDFGVHTLLVEPTAPDEIAGILNFDSIVEAPLVCGLAGAAAWQFGTPAQDTGEQSLGCVARFAAAYHSVSPLQEIEMHLLLDLIRARLAMALAIGCWRVAREPWSAGDTRRENTLVGHRLQRLAAFSQDQACEAVVRACKAAGSTRP